MKSTHAVCKYFPNILVQVNIFSYLRDLRRMRPGLVATQDQYKLVYSLVEEHLVLGNTVHTLDHFLADRGQDWLAEEWEKVRVK